jgi:hypothetical protein
VYFRTSLQDYQKARMRVRYQPVPSLTIAAGFSVLSNQNPAPSVNYDFLSRENSASVLWNPSGGKRFSLSGEYTRSTLRSDVNYLEPQTLDQARSFYRDNAHSAAAMIDLALPRSGQLSLGGSLFRSSGSRPTEYYQPLARLVMPIRRGVAWISEWRYYGFGETFYSYEGFRTHMATTGLRWSR